MLLRNSFCIIITIKKTNVVENPDVGGKEIVSKILTNPRTMGAGRGVLKIRDCPK